MRLCEKAFKKFKLNALANQKFTQYRANLIYLRLKENIGARMIMKY